MSLGHSGGLFGVVNRRSVADLNQDGNADIAVANPCSGGESLYCANTLIVLEGEGNGQFISPPPYAVGANPAALAIADLNNDGRPDVMVANSGSGSFSVLLNLTRR
jgi:hypothetical protein